MEPDGTKGLTEVTALSQGSKHEWSGRRRRGGKAFQVAKAARCASPVLCEGQRADVLRTSEVCGHVCIKGREAGNRAGAGVEGWRAGLRVCRTSQRCSVDRSPERCWDSVVGKPSREKLPRIGGPGPWLMHISIGSDESYKNKACFTWLSPVFYKLLQPQGSLYSPTIRCCKSPSGEALTGLGQHQKT